ncbi:MAG TPA: 50S ribosomal protein L11 [Anaerolineales bacterium]|nr:50S ribosomal protein L11 [Anaerolineales bacterium]
MAKKLKKVVRLQLVGGKATPAPPVGPILAPQGVNLMAFVKEYNARTQSRTGEVVPVDISIYTDNSFTLALRTAPASVLIRKAAGLDKGSAAPNKDKKGVLTKEQVRQIAETKMTDLNAIDIEGAMQMIEGTARSMGVTIKE